MRLLDRIAATQTFPNSEALRGHVTISHILDRKAILQLLQYYPSPMYPAVVTVCEQSWFLSLKLCVKRRTASTERSTQPARGIHDQSVWGVKGLGRCRGVSQNAEF